MEGPLQPTRLADRLADMDKDIRAWGRQTVSHLKGQLLSLNLDGQVGEALNGQTLEQSLNYHLVREEFGDVERVSFRFHFYGFYVDTGTGKNRRVNTPAARRAKKEWIAPIMPHLAESLADMLSEQYADIIAEGATLRVPGQIETKIRK